MSRLFISHSSANNAAAIALCKWLSEQGFDDVFLDIDAERGLVAGQRWQEALKAAADRCEAVLFLISPAWVSSRWCLAEFLLAKTLHKRIFGLIVEPVPLDRIPSEMTAEWQLCELAGPDPQRTFEVSSGAAVETVAFREAGLDLLRRGLERAGLDAKSFPWPPAGDPKRAPYRGLRPLEPEDAAIFFGRDAALVRALDCIRGLVERDVEKIFVVLGASGSGKSSFLRAGIWPRLNRDDLSFFALPLVRPQAAVISGSAGIAAALSVAFARVGEPRSPGRIKEALATADGLGTLFDDLSTRVMQRWVGDDAERQSPTIVIGVDQAEELFNAEGAAEAAVFLDMLSRALASGESAPARRVIVIATIRSDRYEMLQAEPHLSGLKQDLFNLPPMPPAQFRSVVEGPAQRVVEAGGRLVIDPELTERLIADSQGADALPLLAFTLERLYADYGAEGRLTAAEYAKLGGVQGSISQAIEQALADPGRAPAIPAERANQLACLRAAFIPWLARINPETGEPLRRVAELKEMPESSHAIVQRLVDARLIIADRRAGIDVFEVAHESLLRQWPALAAWLAEDADNLKLIEGLERCTAEWMQNGRQAAWLDHRAERLAAAENLARRDDFRKRLGETGLAYIHACRNRDDAERADKEAALVREQARLAEIAAAQKRTSRLQRRTRLILGVLAAVIICGFAAGWWLLSRSAAGLNQGQVNLLATLAEGAELKGDFDSALRFSVYAAWRGLQLDATEQKTPLARAELAALSAEVGWRLALSGQTVIALSAEFSPDDTRVVTALNDGTARIWDAATGTQLKTLSGHTGVVATATFSADGSRIVTASQDETARIWDAASGVQIIILTGHTAAVSSAAFSPDQSRVVTSSFDRTARVWDAATGKQLLVLQHDAAVNSARFSPDGSRIVTASNNTVQIWDATTGRQIAVLRGHTGQVNTAAFSADGSRIVSASSDSTVRVWDAATGKQIEVMRGHRFGVAAAAFSPDGSRIVSASEDQTARLWDARTGGQITILRANDMALTDASFSHDGSRIVTASWDGTARVWDAADRKKVMVLSGHSDTVFSAAYSPDGSKIVTASWDKTARIWDAKTGRQIAVLSGHQDRLYSAAFSPDGSKIVTASADGTARIWDASTGNNLSSLAEGSPLFFAGYSPDGTRIVTAGCDRTAQIYDAASGKRLLTLAGHSDCVTHAAFSPDGSRIVTSSYDGTARVWDAITGKQIRILSGHNDIVWTAAFSHDGSRIITSSHDKTARIWDAATGAPIAILDRDDNFVTSATYSRDGTRIATASSDQTARIYDAATFIELAVLCGHANELRSVAFSPDGAQVVTASQDKTVVVWNATFKSAATTDLIRTACARLLVGFSVFSTEEMNLAAYPATTPRIDACAQE